MKELKLYLDGDRASHLDNVGVTAVRIEIIQEIKKIPMIIRQKRQEIMHLSKSLNIHPMRLRSWVDGLVLWDEIWGRRGEQQAPIIEVDMRLIAELEREADRNPRIKYKLMPLSEMTHKALIGIISENGLGDDQI